MKNAIKLMQLIKGNSAFVNRIDQIQHLINVHNPDIIIINELNISKDDDVSRNQFQNYVMMTDGLDVTDVTSQMGILIHKNIHFKIRQDLEAQGLSTVWVQLTYPGRKPILIQGIYQQFCRLNHPGSVTKQRKRWSRILDKWVAATDEGLEIITAGDMNLNMMSNDKNTENEDPYEKAKAPMIEEMKEMILNNGHVILNTEKSTRNKDKVDSKQTCLDLLITNRRDRIISHQSGIPGFSDHTVQILSRRSKEIKSTNKIIRIR